MIYYGADGAAVSALGSSVLLAALSVGLVVLVVLQKVLSPAQEGVHCAMAVGRNQDQTPPGRRALGQRRGLEAHRDDPATGRRDEHWVERWSWDMGQAVHLQLFASSEAAGAACAKVCTRSLSFALRMMWSLPRP